MNKVINFGCRLNNFEGKKIQELLPNKQNKNSVIVMTLVQLQMKLKDK